eukprot:464630_1
MSFMMIHMLVANRLLFVQTDGSTFDTISTEYQYQDIVCNDNEECIVICDVTRGCKGSTIFCPTHSTCSIGCSDNWSCGSANIHCPEDNTCSISCVDSWSCQNININPPNDPVFLNLSWTGFGSMYNVTYPIYAVDDNSDFSLICDQYGQCDSMNIICPANARCTVSCIGEESCIFMKVQWPSIAGLGTLVCSGETKACYGVTFPIPAPDEPYRMQCSGVWECREATINCPASSACYVTCYGHLTCELATINCPTDGDCDVICQNDGNSGACENANIVWSSKPTSIGTLRCSGTNACLNVDPPPTLNPTTAPTLPPTDASISPSGSPLFPTENPTAHPTKTPTVIPTLSPTDSSNSPSGNPSYIPSRSPSAVSTNPSPTPTDIPTGTPTPAPTAAPTQSPA